MKAGGLSHRLGVQEVEEREGFRMEVSSWDRSNGSTPDLSKVNCRS